jgi:malic enzyme
MIAGPHARDKAMTSNYLDMYRTRNNNGEGFAVGNEDDRIMDVGDYLAADLGGEWTLTEHDGDLAVYTDGTRVVGVGDANGPWACILS